jgi:hypothetical protein
LVNKIFLWQAPFSIENHLLPPFFMKNNLSERNAVKAANNRGREGFGMKY